LGNVAILPGLVNAHAHLDVSDLPAPLGEPNGGLAPWIRRVMDHRRQWPDAGSRSVALGLAESIRSGVTMLADIAQADWPIEAAADVPLSLTLFRELIAPMADRVPGAIELAESWFRCRPYERCFGNTRTHDTSPPLQWGGVLRRGLSPHAPYTVHPELLRAVVALSAAQRVPLAMHLAESPEELELLSSGTGPLRKLLEELGAWDGGLVRPGTRPLSYLRLLAAAHRALVIHGNYLDGEEIGFLAAHAERMAAVYCPRSHEWFGHRPYPLEKMLAAGAVVALGTDGRGSSPDLSLWAEMRAVARRHPGIPLGRVLEMGTISGAQALGCEDVGSLAPGKQADLTIVPLPNHDAGGAYELLFESDGPVASFHRGVTAKPPGIPPGRCWPPEAP
jgi:cytosine/adenosine deaminase-related metal-dependent hydrolase